MLRPRRRRDQPLVGRQPSSATGPRACSRPVAMPISAPMPNSPPSANWVEALRMHDRAVDLAQEALGGRRVLGDDRVGVAASRSARCARSPRRARRPPRTARIASRYSVPQSSSLAGAIARIDRARSRVAAQLAAGLEQIVDDRRRASGQTRGRPAASRSRRRSPVRRILALSAIARALAGSAAAWM